jgi:signal transduction histidine kinase
VSIPARRTLPTSVSFDVALALVFAGVGQIELRLPTTEPYGGSASLAASGAAALLASLPLAWRRRAPLAVLAAITAAILVPRAVAGTTVLFYGGLFPLLVALYSAACFAPAPRDRWALLAPATLLVGLSVEIPDFRTAGEYAFSIAVFVGAWLVGQAARRWRATGERLRSALAELDGATALRERAAVADERARIARELHDVVGHSISVMLLQAGAARLELHPEQTQARATLEAVEETGRLAMAEMRRMVGVLRPGERDAPLEPLPSVQRLDPLLSQMRDAGVEVSLRVAGAPRVLPPGLDLSAYRIVQEALTNVARHAGPVRATVEIGYEPEGLRVEVRNEQPPPEQRRILARRGGHGILGMRERAALFGGRLDAGPGPEGGFAVRAYLRLDGGTA